MVILLHTETGDSLALGLRLQEEGHDVGFFINKEVALSVGRNLIYHVEDFVKGCESADLIVFDHVTKGSLADLLREQGHAVIGAGKCQDVLELDRIECMEVMDRQGITLPETEFFEDADIGRAIDFVNEDGGRWVFKACDNIATDKTFVADDADSMTEYLDHLDETIEEDENKRPKFLLQRVVDGVEVSTERWYALGEPVPLLDNSTFEAKKFLAGDLGCSVGCAGNVVLPHAMWPMRALAKQTIEKLDRFAREHEITGPLDINAIVTEDGTAYFLEITARFGYDAIQAFMAQWDMPIGETLAALAAGDVPDVWFNAKVGGAVRVSVPPYPTGDPKAARGQPVVDAILDDPDVWPGDVMVDENGKLIIAGVDGVVYIMTGTGGTIEEALGACYRRLKQSKLPDRQYRVDLTEVFEKRFRMLRRSGLRSVSRLGVR